MLPGMAMFVYTCVHTKHNIQCTDTCVHVHVCSYYNCGLTLYSCTPLLIAKHYDRADSLLYVYIHMCCIYMYMYMCCIYMYMY